MINRLLRLQDLVNNPSARVPVCLCLDVSGSMFGDPIQELNDGVRQFYDAIRSDEVALYSAEICIVTFGGQHPECIVDFSTLALQPEAPVLTTSGSTPMGEAVNLALDLLERRKDEYKDKGVDYYQPWLVLMTDGAPNGHPSELTRAIDRTVEMINARKLTIYPIGIGNDADMNTLARFSPQLKPLRLKGLKFPTFFQWLSQSVARTTSFMPGENIKEDKNGIKSWAEF